jgi:hypothetical protein
MRIDLREETYYFYSSWGLEGEGMSFCRRKEVNLLTGPARFKGLIRQITLDRCQNPIQLSKSHHVRTRKAFDKPRPLD